MQRRLAKRLLDYCGLSHEHLACTRLITLKERQRRADMEIAFKTLHGAIAIDSSIIDVELSGVPIFAFTELTYLYIGLLITL